MKSLAWIAGMVLCGAWALAEAPINNLPALMQDERAFEWAKAYTCYLQELRQLGPAAYFVDPAKCANPSRP